MIRDEGRKVWAEYGTCKSTWAVPKAERVKVGECVAVGLSKLFDEVTIKVSVW